MLSDFPISSTLPVSDLARARSSTKRWFKDTEGNILAVDQLT